MYEHDGHYCYSCKHRGQSVRCLGCDKADAPITNRCEYCAHRPDTCHGKFQLVDTPIINNTLFDFEFDSREELEAFVKKVSNDLCIS